MTLVFKPQPKVTIPHTVIYIVKIHTEVKHTAIDILKIQHEANSSKTHQTSF